MTEQTHDTALDYRRLSKTVAHALRHEPHLYELELDKEGWTDVTTLLGALRGHKRIWRDLGEAEVAHMVANSSKKRYELSEDGARIRALYGHSTPQKLKKTPGEPPEILYHGTSPEVAAIIRGDGIRSMARQYVHLSVDVDTAMEVGHRKDGKPILLEARAREAHGDGIAFYEGNALVWLADYIPPDYIDG